MQDEKRNCELVFSRLSGKDIDAVMSLQKEIIEGLTDKTLLRNNSREMFISCLCDPNVTIGVWDGDILAAIAILSDARGTEEYLGSDLISVKADSVANMKSVLVKEEYRGRRLQQILMQQCENIAKERGFTHMCATISPDNAYSEKNALAMGYRLDHVAVKYGGLSRNVFVKEI